MTNYKKFKMFVAPPKSQQQKIFSLLSAERTDSSLGGRNSLLLSPGNLLKVGDKVQILNSRDAFSIHVSINIYN